MSIPNRDFHHRQLGLTLGALKAEHPTVTKRVLSGLEKQGWKQTGIGDSEDFLDARDHLIEAFQDALKSGKNGGEVQLVQLLTGDSASAKIYR